MASKAYHASALATKLAIKPPDEASAQLQKTDGAELGSLHHTPHQFSALPLLCVTP